MRLGAASTMRRTILALRPARGGGTTTTPGRFANPHLGAAGGLDELAHREPHVAGEEARVADLVLARVADRVGDRGLDDLEAPDLAGARRDRQGDRPDAAEQVVDALEPGQRGELARDAVEPLGHL